MQFENTTSEIIDNEAEVLSPLNDTINAHEQAFTRSKVIRERKKNIRKQKNGHNDDNMDRIENQHCDCDTVDSSVQYPRDSAQKHRFHHCTSDYSNNHRNATIKSKIKKIQKNNRGPNRNKNNQT